MGAGSAYVMDTELRPACNLSKLDVTSLGNFYKFGEDKFIIGNYIVDNDLNILNSASSGNIYLDEGLIKFGKGGLYGFTDLSGKVVIEANYRGISSSTTEYICHASERQQLDFACAAKIGRHGNRPV